MQYKHNKDSTVVYMYYKSVKKKQKKMFEIVLKIAFTSVK